MEAKYREKITIKLTKADKARLEKALKLSPAPYKGLSYYARAALMDWCADVERFTPRGREV